MQECVKYKRKFRSTKQKSIKHIKGSLEKVDGQGIARVFWSQANGLELKLTAQSNVWLHYHLLQLFISVENIGRLRYKIESNFFRNFHILQQIIFLFKSTIKYL